MRIDRWLLLGVVLSAPLSAQDFVFGDFFEPLPAALDEPTGARIWVAPDGSDASGTGSASAPLQTLARACARATPGLTIELRAGVYRETQQCVLQSNVRLRGAGRSGSTLSVVHAPTGWDFRGDTTTDREQGYVVLVKQKSQVTIEKLSFIGNDQRANGAIRIDGSQQITVRDVAIHDFRFTGLNVVSAQTLDLQHLLLENSGYEWLPGVSVEFPDGGSVGNLGLRNATDALIAHVRILTTDRHGYGVKCANLRRVTLRDMDFQMHPWQSWNGGGPGNFDLELHGGYADQTTLSHNTFRQTVSLMGGNEPEYAAIPYTLHVHHNRFDMRDGVYSIEVGTDKMVIDHNWFRNTWTAIQNYGDSSIRINDLTVFNNVVENVSMRFIGLKGQVENLRVFNNSVHLGNGDWQSYLVTLGSNRQSRNWLIANNAMVGSPDAPAASRALVAVYQSASVPTGLSVRNNVYARMRMGLDTDVAFDPAVVDHRYTNNLEQDPGFGSTALAFEPGPTSPLLDRGDSSYGTTVAFVGAARDVGAFERGVAPWRTGRGSTSTMSYRWAPRTSVNQEWFVNSMSVDLSALPGEQIRYTLDGSEPGASSALYSAPIVISTPSKLRARSFADGTASATALLLDLKQGVRGYPNIGALGVASASSVWDQGYLPARAFDGVTFSWLGWSPGLGDARPWLQVDLGAPKRIRFIELYTRAFLDQPESRRNFEIRASNSPTFANYTVLAAQGATTLPHQAVFDAIVSDPTLYRYVRASKTVDDGFFATEWRVLGE
jgi:hypothetical protein